MRKPLIAGNWKMHGSKASVATLLEQIKADSQSFNSIDIAVFPPFVYLAQVKQALEGTSLHWGAQNVCAYETGAYTGEVAASMLQEFACHYALIGHSERRHLFGEDLAMTAQKFAIAKIHGLIPILCVGETHEQREKGQTLAVIEQQLAAILALPSGIQALQQAVIAYEPVWAIGTGLTASVDQAQQVHRAIRGFLAQQDADIANKIQILYGGSVKADNSAALLAMLDIDGVLVGGASLQAKEFLAICQTALVK